MLSVRPGTFLLPGPDYTPHIKFKTAAAILAVGQRLLCYNTCRIFLILRSDNCSSAPDYCTCRRPLCWRPVKAVECSYILAADFLVWKSWMIILLAAEEKLSPALHQTFAKCINKGLINPPKSLNLIYDVPVLYENIKKIIQQNTRDPCPIL